METVLLIKCVVCKGQQKPEEYLSVDGSRTVKTCRGCRSRILEWKKAHPEARTADYEKHKDAYKQRAKNWHETHKDRAYELNKSWRRANPDKALSSVAKWRSKGENGARMKAWIADWIRANREKMRAYYQRWYVKNQDKLRLLASERQRVYRESDFTFEDWMSILETFGHRCAYCLRGDVKLTMDHVIPLSKGGEHTVENIVPACKPCNSKKNDRPIFVMLNQPSYM